MTHILKYSGRDPRPRRPDLLRRQGIGSVSQVRGPIAAWAGHTQPAHVISHRAEDRFLAGLIKSQLKYLSSLDTLDLIECMVCEDIPGGAEWRKWMIDNTAKADCLIFVHTNAEHNWT